MTPRRNPDDPPRRRGPTPGPVKARIHLTISSELKARLTPDRVQNVTALVEELLTRWLDGQEQPAS